ncbi:hypothetical protein ACFWM5_37065 [Streptomyces bobili]|uniref:hypothetical protein n=1 Tax=Streptomyces bobili TaxID=67280 RepID=UPI00365FD9BF
MEIGQADQQVIAGGTRHPGFTDRHAVLQFELVSSAVVVGDHPHELDEPLVADVGGHDELGTVTVLLHRGPAPGGHVGPAVAAGTGAHDENTQIGHHRPPLRPEVVVDDLHGVPPEERPDM